MNKEEINDLKSLINRRIETEKALLQATWANVKAQNDIESFLWKEEVEAKKRA